MNHKLLLIPSALGIATGCASKQEETKKPLNVIYIMSDDHSFQTISAYSDKFISTPNIDRLANEGMLFERAYVANSISGPSRACMLTGKHSHANGFTNNVNSVFDGTQQTLPKLLQAGGYQTAVVGKWHLTSDPIGFDHWDILIGQGEYYNPHFILNGKKEQVTGYATELTNDRAIDWLENGRDKNKPYVMWLHHKAPHRTWMPDLQDLSKFDNTVFELPETFYDNYEGRTAAAQQEMSIDKDMCLVYDLKLADKEKEIRGPLEQHGRAMYNNLNPEQKAAWDAHYDPIIKAFKEANLSGKELVEWKYQQYMRDYLATVVSLDRTIGKLFDYLEETDQLDNTLIFYTADQGFYMGEHGWFDKRFMYEESYRTPLLIRMPGGKKLGKTDALVQNIDFAPTILDFVGMAIPEDMHGESLMPILEGEQKEGVREALYYHFYEYPAEHAVKRHYGVSTDRYKLIHFYNDIDTWELYDLESDPREMNNIYGKQGTEQITKDLREQLVKLQKQYNDTTALKQNNF